MDVPAAIIGAGPAGLSVGVAMAQRRPSVVADRDLRVLDPAGSWLANWDRQMASQGIRHLRSPVVHHPHPEPFALLEQVDRARGLRHVDGLHLPSVVAFADFCAGLVERLDLGRVLLRGTVVAAEVASDGVRLHLADGSRICADRVVVATNPRRRVVPGWARGLDPALVTHGGRLVGAVLPGRRVLVVGGGLSAAHLALGAAAAGAEAIVVARRQPTVRRMDVEPRWLGPARMGPFAGRCAEERAAAVARARGGGSMPPWASRARGRADGVQLWTPDEVAQAVAVDGRVVIGTTAGRTTTVDEVWLATGGVVDLEQDPVLAAACRSHPIAVHQGLPDLGHDLRWGTAPVWVAGAPAALRIGPMAGNLFGHRHAGQRIADSLCGVQVP